MSTSLAIETGYGTPWAMIQATVTARMGAQSPLLEKMREVKERYNGDWILPDFEGIGNLQPALIADAIDHTAMAAAQQPFSIWCPSVNGRDKGLGSLDFADKRQRLLYALHEKSGMGIGLGRVFRHLAGYATCALVAQPVFDKDRTFTHMEVSIRDPLTCFPEVKAPEDPSPPANVAFVYGRSAEYLRRVFPQSRKEHGGPISTSDPADGLWEIVDWWDDECRSVGILGRREQITRPGIGGRAAQHIELFRSPNRIGSCPAIVPARVTLDKVMSQVANIVGQVDLAAKLAALDVIAAEKAIFPDKYLIGSGPGVVPQLVGGQWADGRSGQVNLLMDTGAVGEMRGTPDPSGKIAIDRLERNASKSAGLVPQQTGETYGALRTGRGIDALYSAAVDPRQFELHRIVEHSFPALNAALLAGMREYGGRRTFSFYTGFKGDDMLEVVPAQHIEITDNTVKYAMPGSDIQGITISLGQLLAAQVISKASYRTMHPWINNEEREAKAVLIEQLEDITTQALLQRAQAGGIPPADMVAILRTLRETGDIVAAVQEADRLAQERQAQQAPEPEPGQVVAPEAVPGLASPGEGAEMAPAPQAIQPPNDSQAALRQMQLVMQTGARR